MTADQTLVLLVLLVALLSFVRARLRHDVVAFGALMLAVLVGVVPADEALSGFGHPAVFTVACVLMISRTLRNSGVMHAFAERLARARRGRRRETREANLRIVRSSSRSSYGGRPSADPIWKRRIARATAPAAGVPPWFHRARSGTPGSQLSTVRRRAGSW